MSLYTTLDSPISRLSSTLSHSMQTGKITPFTIFDDISDQTSRVTNLLFSEIALTCPYSLES